MSIQIMSWVWQNSPYEGKALLLHLALGDFADDAGRCWPSQTTLARRARCTTRHVRDTISQMIEDGYVVLERASNGRDSHRYRLTNKVADFLPKSVPERKSEAVTPEVDDHDPGNWPPKNHQEPSKEPKRAVHPKAHWINCEYCEKWMDPAELETHLQTCIGLVLRRERESHR